MTEAWSRPPNLYQKGARERTSPGEGIIKEPSYDIFWVELFFFVYVADFK